MKQSMKQFFINFGKNTFKGLTIGVSFILGIFLVVYAAGNIAKLDENKNSGDKLTLSSWNNLVDSVNTLITQVNELITQVNAGTSNGGGGYSLPTDISGEQNANTLANAINGCRGMLDGGGWRLPTQEELALFIGTSTSTNYLWTRTVSPAFKTHYRYGTSNVSYYSLQYNWIYMRLSDGLWNTNGDTTHTLKYRCVR